MNNKYKLLFFITFFICKSNFAQYTDVINSNRPGKSMSAFAVGKSVFQVESGFFGIQEKHQLLDYEANGFGVDFNLRWGIFLEQLEAIAEIQYQADQFTNAFSVQDRSAFRSMVFGAKYLVYDPNKYYEQEINIRSWKANQGFKWRQLIPSVAIFAGVNLNPSNNPFNYNSGIIESTMSPKLALITQNTLGTRWVLVGNAIYNKISSSFKSLEYIVTLTHGINYRWSLFAENQGFKGDYYTDLVFRGGGAFLISPSLQVDASFSKNIKDTPEIMYGGIGISWRFDNNYENLRILSPKDYKKNKENKSAKTKKTKLKKNKQRK